MEKAFLTDIEIAQQAELLPIDQIAGQLGLTEAMWEPYGRTKAKLVPEQMHLDKPGNLVLVTAMSPTPAGEGKTTMAVGLADGLKRIGEKVILALREPSLGPVFGMKGGAAGGGYAQVVPMEDINLHFTGDLHAITAANNLLAAMVDNHLHFGNELDLDPQGVSWRRCMDMNDRQLRNIVSGLGGGKNGAPREDGFNITAASEVMAILCLASDPEDLKRRLGNIVVGYNRQGQPVTAEDLGAAGAMAALLREAIRPNLVQTLEHTPALVHGGPFANIAHGCSTLIATRMGLGLADWCVTEAGFGADLGAEKFLDIKCRVGGLAPKCVVMVATVRALKHHGGAVKGTYAQENLEALSAGLPNLERHVRNIVDNYHLPVVVCLNNFPTDTEAEIALVQALCDKLGVKMALSQAWEKGGAGAEDLARAVVATVAAGGDGAFAHLYADNLPLKDKVTTIAQRIYGAKKVSWQNGTLRQLRTLTELGYGNLPVCIAKTQYSFSDDPKKLGAPEGFTLTVREIRLSAGAGFVVVLTGEIMTMPGMPKAPAALKVDIDAEGRISGLF